MFSISAVAAPSEGVYGVLPCELVAFSRFRVRARALRNCLREKLSVGKFFESELHCEFVKFRNGG